MNEDKKCVDDIDEKLTKMKTQHAPVDENLPTTKSVTKEKGNHHAQKNGMGTAQRQVTVMSCKSQKFQTKFHGNYISKKKQTHLGLKLIYL